ncbi:DUF3376 domain-containing protein [Streptomyces sp. NPDC048404]|uniref:DUF3376 domain-containing protein n=1 Tax=unclassified Streptomyces TaxID=2593676 RepID=UPI00341B0CB4
MASKVQRLPKKSGRPSVGTREGKMNFRGHDHTDGSGAIESPIEEAQLTEIRLALVMNGGVSLAVWMGGVAHELDLLRRASRNDSPESVDERDRPVFKLWRDLAKDARKKIRIDVVSGTSAGGLNGLLLATAIGRRAALPDLRSLWKSSASLNALLSDPPREEDNSVLNGDWFQERIRQAIDAIQLGPHEDETITLFVTATALGGRCRTFKDGFDQHFDIGDHRRVYLFKNQPPDRSWQYTNRREDGEWSIKPLPGLRDFSIEKTEALMQAARATASFPIAFSPVSEAALLDHRVLPEPVYGDPASSVMDGGVLNNAPFGPVLGEITKRRVDERPVERYIVYVVPSDARLTENEIKNQWDHEIPLSTIALSALNYPREADMRSGTEELKHRLETSVRSTREKLFKRLVCADEKTQGDMLQIAEIMLDEYRKGRINAVLPDVHYRNKSEERVTPLVPPPELDDDVIDDILNHEATWFPREGEKLGKPDMEKWRWGIIVAERFLQTLGHYLHDRLSAKELHKSRLTPEQRTAVVTGTRFISDQLRMTIAVRDSYKVERDRGYVRGAEMGAREAALKVDRLFKELDIPAQVGKLVKEAADCFLKTLREINHDTSFQMSSDVVSAYVKVEILTQAYAPRAKVIDELTPQFTFMRLGPDEMGPLFQEDWSANIGAKKLYGIRFQHFGAFMDEDWRHSDFTWGRLDAAHYLLPLLLPHDNRTMEKKLHNAILASEDLPGVDKNDSPVERMRERLKQLNDYDDAQLLDEEAAKDMRNAGDKLITVSVPRLYQMPAKLLWHRKWAKWRKASKRR